MLTMASFPGRVLLFVFLSVLLSLCPVQAWVYMPGFANYPRSLSRVASAPVPSPMPHHHKGHYHHHQPSPAPAHPPAHPPVHPPVHPPAMPPTLPHPHLPRKLVAVQGVVYCKPCMFVGVETLWKAKPLEGAVVKLTCNNTKYKPVVEQASTDKNGYFLILAKNVTNVAFHKCSVALVKSPSKQCDVPTNFKGGWKGAMLVPSFKPPPKTWPKIYELFNVGPFAYEPSKNLRCAPSP